MENIIRLKVKEIKPNPFKKYINKGKLNEDGVAKMIESLKHGTLPMIFTVRKNNNDGFELCYGHHRLQAIKEVKGTDFEVNCEIVNYDDEKMLVDMVRENLTQRDTDFHDTEDSIVLARAWQESKASTVNQFNSATRKIGLHRKGLEGSEPAPDSYRSIANFLSKEGKTISYPLVKYYLDIHDKLDSDIHKQVEKFSGAEDKTDKVTIKQAVALTLLDDHKEQREILKNLRTSREQLGWKQEQLIRKYKEAPEIVKNEIRKGQRDIADLEYIDAKTLEVHKIIKESEEEFIVDVKNVLTNLALRWTPRKVQQIVNYKPEFVDKFAEIIIYYIRKLFAPTLEKLGYEVEFKVAKRKDTQ